MMKRSLLVLAAVAALTMIPAAVAGTQPHGSPTGTISGPLDAVTLQSVSASYGDSVVFEIGGATLADSAWVKVLCYQGHDLVYYGFVSYYNDLDWQSRVFTLTNDQTNGLTGLVPWNGGAASCTADVEFLWGKNHKVVDKIAFEVAA